MDASQTPTESTKTNSTRPWPVRALTLLLFLQAFSLFGLAVYKFDLATLPIDSNFFDIAMSTFTNLTQSLAFGVIGLLAIIAAFGFLWLGRTGWLTAILVQGLVLLVAIGLYLRGEEIYIFGLMSFSIFMVIYLHHPEVQQAFQAKKTQNTKLDESS